MQTSEVNLPSLRFKRITINQSEIQKHVMNSKLDFKENIKNVLNKVKKVMGLLLKLQKILQRPPFITIYKSFII